MQHPYFSRDIAEFWRRWHISLSTWFRDYLYIPLGGSRGGTWMKVRNTFAIFLVSGFWHGANWTFIIWGALNAIYFLPLLLTNNNRKNLGVVAEGKLLPSFRELFAMLTTFILTVFAWIFFRAENISHAFSYIGGIFSDTILDKPVFNFKLQAIFTILLIIFLLFLEWFGKGDKFALEKILLHLKKPYRYFLYLLLALLVFFMAGKPAEFIYFQF